MLIALAQSLEVKNGALLWPVRIAAAGQTVTPGGAGNSRRARQKEGGAAPFYSSAFKKIKERIKQEEKPIRKGMDKL